MGPAHGLPQTDARAVVHYPVTYVALPPFLVFFFQCTSRRNNQDGEQQCNDQLVALKVRNQGVLNPLFRPNVLPK